MRERYQLVSIKRSHPQHVYIAITNIFFGSTGFGWIISLPWALNGQARHSSAASR
jgi:hypothetical protein